MTAQQQADHLIRIDRAAYWSRRPGPWLARCGSCEWAGRFESREDAVKAGVKHQSSGTAVFGPAAGEDE